MDLTAQIVEAITAWLGSVAAQLYAPALASAGDLLFATPSFDLIPEVVATWELVRNVADALLLLGVTAAGILVMAAGSDARYSAKVLLRVLSWPGSRRTRAWSHAVPSSGSKTGWSSASSERQEPRTSWVSSHQRRSARE